MEQGYLALVLHAHLPFVRHPESEKYLEERWLFEAVTETYIPLLQVFQGLIRDGVDFRMTMSLTPPLVSMLTDKLLQERYLKHLDRLIELADKETVRTEQSSDFNRLARFYANTFRDIRSFYVHYDRNLIEAFREVQDHGELEIITSAATHAFLPLVMTDEAVRAQIETAVVFHERHFGRRPKGIWLPECGYKPELDLMLKEFGLEYFFTDSHGLLTASPAPVFGTLSPVITPHGVAAFGRDEESSKQVWSAQEGYPGDFDYREWYRDIGYDLDIEIVGPYLPEGDIRVNTGIKYYRITGSGEHKEPYNPECAQGKAAVHAGNFIFNRAKQVEYWSAQMGRKPIVVAPFDAELFGHWWYEGPTFIDMLFRKIHFDQDTIRAITPSEYLTLYPDYQVCRLPMSSWGRHGYADVWLRGENDWIYPALHEAEQRMIRLANLHRDPDESSLRALNQAARELMLAQSSDWAFIMDSKTMVDYAVKRTKYHLNRFNRLFEMLESRCLDPVWLSEVEWLDNVFPDINYRSYQSRHVITQYERQSHKPRILMLSWEFPPMTVGGLSRHVYDLSRYLVKHGWEVHVITTEFGDCPHDEVVEGVHVHRVHVIKPDCSEFIHWDFQLNLMMVDACRTLSAAGLTFDLVHAHDWLVHYAAKTIKEFYRVPLIATIHATEHGRNNGIYTDLQRYIHGLEWELTYESWRVIVCSNYMRREVETVFQLPPDKIDVLPNGVDPDLLRPSQISGTDKQGYASDSEQVVLFLGRLVREKGVHTLLEAAPSILQSCPNAKFLVVGDGPARGDLEARAEQLGIRGKVQFTGFVTDVERNRLLHVANVAVFPSLYEPFGIVALEAMAAGRPVIVSDVGGLADVVEHGRNGLKMYPGDKQSLASQVTQVLLNPEWAKTLAETAYGEIGNYDWNRIAIQTIAVYERVLRERNSQMNVSQIAVAVEKS